MKHLTFRWLTVVWILSLTVYGCSRLGIAADAAENKIVAPNIPGLDVKVGQTVLIQPDAWYPVAFRFADGRIVVSGNWSTDGGHTWRKGPASPDKACIELGGGEVLSLGFSTKKRPDGKYNLSQRRSLDGWKTVTAETSVVDIPRSVPQITDDGGTVEGFAADHAILRLKDGRLMTTMYGNYEVDKTPGDRYPATSHFYKNRVIVVFSSDKGKTWGNPITVTTPPKVSEEGGNEPDLARTANGDIICAIRTEGGCPDKTFSPCYLCRSRDEGRTWSEPQVILDRGVWPNLCVMRSGIIVCTTGRPGDWLVFSTDDGRTWRGSFCFYPGGGPYPASSSYNSVFETAPDTILVIYDRAKKDAQGKPGHEIVGTFFTVRKRAN